MQQQQVSAFLPPALHFTSGPSGHFSTTITPPSSPPPPPLLPEVVRWRRVECRVTGSAPNHQKAAVHLPWETNNKKPFSSITLFHVAGWKLSSLFLLSFISHVALLRCSGVTRTGLAVAAEGAPHLQEVQPLPSTFRTTSQDLQAGPASSTLQPAPPSSLQPAPPSTLQQCAGPLPLFPTDNRASVDSSGVQGRTTAELGQQHSCASVFTNHNEACRAVGSQQACGVQGQAAVGDEAVGEARTLNSHNFLIRLEASSINLHII